MMAIEPKVKTTSTWEEADEAGFLGSVVEVLPPEAYTVQGVVSGPAVTDDEYAERKRAEARPPDVADLSDESSARSEAKASKTTSKSPAS